MQKRGLYEVGNMSEREISFFMMISMVVLRVLN